VPFLVKCHNCGHTLFFGDDKDFERLLYRTHGAKWHWRKNLPEYVAYHYGFKCPGCGVELHRKPVDIKILPWNGNKEEISHE